MGKFFASESVAPEGGSRQPVTVTSKVCVDVDITVIAFRRSVRAPEMRQAGARVYLPSYAFQTADQGPRTVNIVSDHICENPRYQSRHEPLVCYFVIVRGWPRGGTVAVRSGENHKAIGCRWTQPTPRFTHSAGGRLGFVEPFRFPTPVARQHMFQEGSLMKVDRLRSSAQ